MSSYKAGQYNADRLLMTLLNRIKADDWPAAQDRAAILLDYLHEGSGPPPRLSVKMRGVLLRSYCRYVINLAEQTKDISK